MLITCVLGNCVIGVVWSTLVDVKGILPKIKTKVENVKFSDKSRYDKYF